MKESAKLQCQIDRANFRVKKPETKAFYEEQKRLSRPSVRVESERKRMQRELNIANKRVEKAQVKVDNAKITIMKKYKLKTNKIENTIENTYKKIENGIVESYQAIEDTLVGTYKKIENKFIERFLEEKYEDSDNNK